MRDFREIILSGDLALWAILIIAIVYLVLLRIEDKNAEEFEDRSD